MRDSFKVARWEIRKVITSKVFLITTFVVPIIMLLIGGTVGYFASRDNAPETLRIGIIDKTEILGEELEQSFAKRNYEAILLSETGEDYRQIISKKKLDGILIIPDSVFTTNRVNYYFKDLQGLEEDTLRDLINPLVVNRRLKSKGYDPQKVRALLKDVQIYSRSLTENRPGGISSMFVPLGLAMLMVFASMFSGGALMQSIIKEKSNRIVELILSSISVKSLMSGKVMGYGVLGILQISIWSVSALLVSNFFFDISLTPLLNVKTIYMVIYFILGFILIASINAIVGSGMKEAQSGSQSTGFLIIIPIIPIYFAGAIINNPAGTISRVLSYIPFTTSTTMLIRLGFSSPPILEIGFTIVMLVIVNYLLVRLAAKIFRVGMLMYGKNASFKELFRWARSRDY